MEFGSDEVKYRCACGKYEGTQNGLMAHKRHCTLGKSAGHTLVVPDRATAEPEPPAPTPAPEPEPPAAVPEDDDEDPWEAPLVGEPGQAAAESLVEYEAEEPDEFALPAAAGDQVGVSSVGIKIQEAPKSTLLPGPTKLREAVNLPVIWRTIYDAFRLNKGFEGSFSDFIEQSLTDYFECLGYELVLAVRDSYGTVVAVPPNPAVPLNGNGNGHREEVPIGV